MNANVVTRMECDVPIPVFNECSTARREVAVCTAEPGEPHLEDVDIFSTLIASGSKDIRPPEEPKPRTWAGLFACAALTHRLLRS